MPAETHSHGHEVGRDEVEALVVDRLAELLGRDPDELRPELRLRDDLDGDDLLVLDLVQAVEEELGERMVGLELSDDDVAELETIGDAVDCVCNHLERRSAVANQAAANPGAVDPGAVDPGAVNPAGMPATPRADTPR